MNLARGFSKGIVLLCLLTVLLSLSVSACGMSSAAEALGDAENPLSQEDRAMTIAIGDRILPVVWEVNASVDALKGLCPLTVQMSMYGGFEQVGSLGSSLPRDDVQTTTQPGDIVLYSGNQIVVFYGSNSWAYTRLGRIEGLSTPELKELLGNGDVILTIEDSLSELELDCIELR